MSKLFGLMLVGLVLVGGCAALVVVAAVAGDDSSDADAPAASVTTERSASTTTTGSESAPSNGADDASNDESDGDDEPAEPEPAGDEADDIQGCTVVDDRNIRIELTNNSSKTSSYWLDVALRDDSGRRVGDDTTFITHVRSGEQVSELGFVFDMAGGTECEVIEVNRTAAESPDDLGEVICTVSGEDSLGDIDAEVVATNGSSKTSTYSVTAALVRDGVRIGNGSAVIENVAVGESAPEDLLTTTDGPADGVSCEVVHVERTFSGVDEGDDGVVGEASETDDVTGCAVIDDDTIRIDLTNNSSKTSTYTLNVVFRDGNGERVGTKRPSSRTSGPAKS